MAIGEKSTNPLVMIVDDDEVDRAFIARALKSGYRVIEAANGREACDLIAESPPDCIVLDYNIPRTDTMDLLTKWFGSYPVVVLTGQGDDAVATSLMKAGARDYLRKGTATPEDIGRSVGIAMEKMGRERAQNESRLRLIANHKREKVRRKDLETDMRIARDIQQRLVPRKSPEVSGLDLAGVYLPTKETSGDFFTYLMLQDGSLGIAAGDVAGHGVGPALLASELRAMLRALSCNESDLARIATTTNRLFWEDTSEARFATVAMAAIDTRSWTVRHTSAGQNSYLIRSGGEIETLNSHHMAMGLSDETEYTSIGPLSLNTGDVLFMTTDGIIESVSPTVELFTAERCLDEIRANQQEPAERIIDCLIRSVRQFMDGEPFLDDVTVVIARVTEDRASQPTPVASLIAAD